MLPIAGALQRIAERAGRLAHRVSPCLVSQFPDAKPARSELRRMWYLRTSFQRPRLHWPDSWRRGPTRSYAATRTLLKAWSSGGVAAADLVMLDVAMELYNGADAQRGFANTADAFDKDIERNAGVRGK